MRNCGRGFLTKLASRPVKPPKFPAARAVQGAAPPPPGGGAAPPHPKSATLTATIIHAWFGPPVDVPGLFDAGGEARWVRASAGG